MPVNMKRPLILSVILHISFFSAALFLSAGLIKGSRNIAEDSLVFVRLAEYQSGQDSDDQDGVKDDWTEQEPAAAGEEKPSADSTPGKGKVIKTVQKTRAPVEPAEKTGRPEKTETAESQVDGERLMPEDILNVRRQGRDGSGEQVGENRRISVNGIADSGTQTAAASPVLSPHAGGERGSEKFRGIPDPDLVAIIGRAIEKVKTYPLLARRRGLEGTVHVSFLISSDGTPRSIEIMKSSGHRILDNATVRVVKKAGPYPLFAKRVEVPVAYRLRD